MAIETLLVAVGPGEPEQNLTLQRTVVDIAAPTGADVTLAHVFDEDEFRSILRQLDYDPDDRPDPDEVVRRYERHREFEDRLDEADIAVENRGIRRGDDSRGAALVGLATEIDADMVFVGGRRRSPAGKAVFGSTAQDVMLNAPCPVTYVRSD